MPDFSDLDFVRYSQDKLKPAITLVTARRRFALLLAIATAFILFLAIAAAVYLFLSPYHDLMQKHGFTYWPLLLLLPASLALLDFGLVYILLLRRAVAEFRESLVDCMTEFIDPSLGRTPNTTVPAAGFDDILLPPFGGSPSAGNDVFHGRAGGAEVRFFDLKMKTANRGGETLTGLYFQADFDRRFRAPVVVFPGGMGISRSDVETLLRGHGEFLPEGLVRLEEVAGAWQALTPPAAEKYARGLLSLASWIRLGAVEGRLGAGLAMSCIGGTLRLALLAPRERADVTGVFDGFDFGHCREFCRDAVLCLDVARELSDRDDMWRDNDATA